MGVDALDSPHLEALDAPLLETEEHQLAAEEQRAASSTSWLTHLRDPSNPLLHTTPFICGQELGERLCFYGIATNLYVLLRPVLSLSLPRSCSLLSACFS